MDFSICANLNLPKYFPNPSQTRVSASKSIDSQKRATHPRDRATIHQNHDLLTFNFQAIQLNRLNWRDFLQHHNPVAVALMSKMNILEADRPKVKVECLRLLVNLPLDPARIYLISSFVDTYLRLNQA
jgi:hypothetical protein